MDDYLELLILAYFREVGEEYSLYELKEIIGVSIKQIEEMVDALLDEKLLMYQNYLLTLSIKGRNKLANSEMENYSFKSDNYIIMNKRERWPLEKPYPIHDFLTNKWRGSEK